MIVPFYFPFNLIMNEPFFQPRNNSFAPRTVRNSLSFSSIISCIGGGIAATTRSPSGYLGASSFFPRSTASTSQEIPSHSSMPAWD